MFELLQYAFVFLTAASSAIARPANNQRQTSNSSIIAVVGAQGGVYPRLEINELQQNADQWNIYLLAVQAFQAMDISDPLSWYQICGIHGVPYVAWDGVEGCSDCNPNVGYCTHSSTLFPNWHRAYVALFEQSLQANALAMANQFTGSDRARYVKAATQLRAPYWDWALLPAAGEPAFPDVFTTSSVVVNTPSGQQTIRNPLLLYDFGSAPHSFMQTPFTPDSDITVRNSTLTYQARETLHSDMYTLLTANQGYTSFSTESLTSFLDNFNPYSIEMIHDRVHTLVGGDMAFIPTAAFDPVFWLHHGAVDHAFALWQAAYPTSWIEPWKEVGGSFTYTPGTIEDADSDLTPFRANSGAGFWTPDAVRDTTVLGYNYKDLTSGESIGTIINSLYGPNSGTTSSKRDANEKNGKKEVEEYIVDIRADSMGMEGSFTVFFFNGDFNETDPRSWHDSPSLVARHGFFTGPEKKGDGNAISNAAVSLTPSLQRDIKAGKLKSLENEDVKEYLKQNLQVQIKMQHGRVVDAGEIPGFEVAVMTSTREVPASSDRLPVWSPFKVLLKL